MSKLSFIMGAALAALSSVSALAADMAVKAQPNIVGTFGGCVPQSCSGWYAGFGILGDGNNADVVGNGVNGSVFSTGGALKVQGGYQLWNGQWFAAIEGSVGYEFTTNATAGIITKDGGSRFIGMELVKLGYNFFPSPQSAAPTPGQSPTVLTVPANLLASSTPYLTFGGMQRKGNSQWVNGAGIQTIIAAGWSTDVKYLYAPSQNGEAPANIVMFEVNKHF